MAHAGWMTRSPGLSLALGVLITSAACDRMRADDSTGVSADGSTAESEADDVVTSGEGVCPGDPGTSTGGTGPMSAGLCPDHPQVDACCCFDPQDPGVNPYKVVCGQHFLCQEVVAWSDDAFAQPEDSSVNDCAPAIDCALEALRKGEPGTIRLKEPNGYGEEVVLFHLVGDGTAFRSGYYSKDLSWDIYPVERYKLRDPAQYADCAAHAEVMARYGCLKAALGGEPLEVCVEAGGGSDI